MDENTALVVTGTYISPVMCIVVFIRVAQHKLLLESHFALSPTTLIHSKHCPPLQSGPWNARSATVLGQRGAWVFSSEAAQQLSSTIAGVSVSRISNGDVLDLNTYQITPAGESC